MKNLKRFMKKEYGTWALVAVTLLVGGFSIWTSNFLYQNRARSVAPNAPESSPLASGNCTLTYTISTSSVPNCPPGTTLLFSSSGGLSVGESVAAGGTVSSLNGTWNVRLISNRLMAEDGSRITVNFPTNVVLDSVLIYDNDPKSGESPWSINGRSLPTTPGGSWGPLYSLNLTTNQMVFNNGGDSPHFNVCVKTDVTATPTGTSSINTNSLVATEDTYVNSDSASRNYGSGDRVYADGSPVNITYLKFDLTSLANTTVNNAKLRLRVYDASSGSLNLKSVTSNSWSESSMTYNNKPSLGSVITTFTTGSSTGIYKEIDLTNFVNYNKGRVVSLAIDTANSDNVGFRSSEYSTASYRPTILINSGGTSSGPTPTVSTNNTPTPISSDGSQLSPVADSYVRSDDASRNLGTQPSVRADGSPVMITYMKFDLTSLANQTVNRAYLRMYVTNRTAGTLNIKNISNSWSETGVTYNNRPTLGSTIRTFTAPSSTGVWASVEITTFVNNNKGREVSIAIDTTSGDDYIFNSTNSSTNKPYILIQ